MTEIKRRDFLKVLGVTGAGTAVSGCSTGDVERLLPYVVHPEEITPGVATWYTTVCDGCSAGCGMWVRTREGKAVKVEGNPNHPVSQGGLCSKGHASLQHLYNPDRFHGPMIREGDTFRQGTWDEAEQLLAAKIRASGNMMFIGGHTGPTMNTLIDEFVTTIGGTRVHYDAVSDAPLREAARLAYGADSVPRYEIENARLLLSFGNDLIEAGHSPVENHRGFARMSASDDHGSKGRFVYLGARLSVTGMNADEWIPIQPGSEAAVALGMASVIAQDASAAGPYASLLSSYTAANAAQVAGVSEDAIRSLAERFVADGPTLALGPGAGTHHRGATAANLAVMILNHVAGNVGRTVHYDAGMDVAASSYSDIAGAVSSMASGQVGVAIVHAANPAYSMPASSGFAEAFAQVDFKVSFASAMDETAAMADLIMPDRHFLESWGDSAPRMGVMAIQQPVMQAVPHFDTKQAGDALLAVATHLGNEPAASTFYEYLRASHMEAHDVSMGDFETAWQEALRVGAVSHDMGMGADAATLQQMDAALSFDPPTFDGSGDFTLIVHPSPRFGGGEFSNSPWMLEQPDPVSKITWHSWLEMNPATMEARGLREGDIATVASSHGSLDVPIWPFPGIREDAVALAMGGGHTDMGRWATGAGVNAMTLLGSDAEAPSGALPTISARVTVTPTGERRRMATIDGSDGDQRDRPIAPAVALADLGHADEEHDEGGHGPLRELQGVGGFVPVDAHGGEPDAFPLEGAQHGEYADAHEGPRWAMAIDMDKCTGCSACVTACHSENNVPWVGEEQVLMGRDMNWIRIERYYEHVDATHASHLDVRFLPMICQHCGNAPCEPVCPVFATYHTPEGVNAQVYNRCVGTRYCANNCPYKVRVYNWYRYTDENVPEPMNWQWNPDVTVRTNGIMEKCSFCMQRVREVENRAALEDGREIHDGEIVPACQQSCPAEAIVFGNIRDEESRVAQVVASERTYRALDELINTQPAVNYLKKVTFHEVSGGHE